MLILFSSFRCRTRSPFNQISSPIILYRFVFAFRFVFLLLCWTFQNWFPSFIYYSKYILSCRYGVLLITISNIRIWLGVCFVVVVVQFYGYALIVIRFDYSHTIILIIKINLRISIAVNAIGKSWTDRLHGTIENYI